MSVSVCVSVCVCVCVCVSVSVCQCECECVCFDCTVHADKHKHLHLWGPRRKGRLVGQCEKNLRLPYQMGKVMVQALFSVVIGAWLRVSIMSPEELVWSVSLGPYFTSQELDC